MNNTEGLHFSIAESSIADLEAKAKRYEKEARQAFKHGNKQRAIELYRHSKRFKGVITLLEEAALRELESEIEGEGSSSSNPTRSDTDQPNMAKVIRKELETSSRMLKRQEEDLRKQEAALREQVETLREIQRRTRRSEIGNPRDRPVAPPSGPPPTQQPQYLKLWLRRLLQNTQCCAQGGKKTIKHKKYRNRTKKHHKQAKKSRKYKNKKYRKRSKKH